MREAPFLRDYRYPSFVRQAVIAMCVKSIDSFDLWLLQEQQKFGRRFAEIMNNSNVDALKWIHSTANCLLLIGNRNPSTIPNQKPHYA